ncbi:uridine kinase activity protein [Scheffersomyces amazonensis]|uniref:uridine kinase activity protein n=1 Tax=Scheffersomyces amazonensis TaxID=1078765 RepID=UPI00315C752C
MTQEQPAKQRFNKIVLVAFGGPSSSGKTTSAAAIKSLFKHAILIHLDDFYIADSKIPIDSATGYQNWDCPEALDFNLFENYLKKLKSGQGLEEKLESRQPSVDLKLNQEEEQLLLNKIQLKIPDSETTLFILVDGFMLFHDPKILELFDVNLFFRASFETLRDRRESRDGYNTVEGFWVDPPHYFEKIVWPAFVSSHKYLFENEDINSKLLDNIKSSYKLHDIINENGSNLIDLVGWSIDNIAQDIN